MTKQDLVRVVQLAETACQEYAFQRLKLGRAVIVAKTADGRTRLGWDQSDVDAIEAVAAYAPSSPPASAWKCWKRRCATFVNGCWTMRRADGAWRSSRSAPPWGRSEDV